MGKFRFGADYVQNMWAQIFGIFLFDCAEIGCEFAKFSKHQDSELFLIKKLTENIFRMSPEYKNMNYSYLMVLISCFFWVSGYIYSNNHNVSPIETSMIRGFFTMVGCYAILIYKGESVDNKTSMKILCLRNILMGLHGMFVAFAQFYLPLPLIHTLGSTGPFFVLLIECLKFGKKLTNKNIVGAIFTIFGIIIIANGRMISKFFGTSEFTSTFHNYKTQDFFIILFMTCSYIFMNILWATSVLMTSQCNTSAFGVNFNLGVVLLLFNSFLYFFIQDKTETSIFYWGVFWSGGSLFLAEITFVSSILLSQHIGKTMMLSSMTIVVAYFYSIFIYQEPINLFCLGGSAIVVFGLSKIVL